MPKSARPTRHRDRWRIRWHDHSGTRRSKVFATYDEADRELRARQAETDAVRRGERSPDPDPHNFGELADHWEAHRLPQKRSPKDDLSILRRLRAHLRGVALTSICQEQVDAYISRHAHLSSKTLRNHVALLQTMLNHSEQMRWLRLAPRLKKPSASSYASMKDKPWLRTQEGIARLLSAARAMAIDEEPQSWVPFVLYATAIWTGLRAGELAGLRWSDVNFETGVIDVMRSFNGKTKTPASQRYVPIQHSLRPVLVDWKERCPATALDLVFPNKVGKMFEPSARVFQETLHRALDEAGFERPTTGRRVHVITFHSLRHTFACWWMLSGGSLDRLVRVLGHTTKAMTEYYANVGGYAFPDDLARLDGTIGAVLTGRALGVHEESTRAAS